MSTHNTYSQEEEFESFSIKNFLLLCLGYWKWFLASIVVFVGMGLFYVYTRQPVYERSEQIIVTDQESGGGVGDVSKSFTDLGLFANQTSVYNELIAFTSPAVMQEVVKRLDLTLNLTKRDGLRKKTLYGTNQPFLVEFPDLSETENVGFRVTLQPDGTYRLSKFWKFTESGRVKFDAKTEGRVDGAVVSTPIGKVVLVSNPGYVPGDREDEELVVDVFKQSYVLAVEKYVAKLKGDLADQDSEVIDLSIQDTSVERANDILNTVVEVYNERWIEDKNKVALATTKFISERLEVIKSELDQVDSDIADHKSMLRIPDIEKAAEGYMTQDFMMTEEFLRVSNYLAMTSFLKEYLQDPANKFNIIPMNTGTENAVLEDQIRVYNELLLERNNLAENSGANNPLVKDRDKALAGMRSSIMRSVDSQIANLQGAMSNIAKAQSSTRSELSQTPQKAKALLSVERQQLVMDQLYLFLLQKREETELTQKFTADNTRIITPPYGKQKPVSPKKALIVIISFILGLGIPAAALIIAEAFNTKIRSRKDIESLPAPYAGEIPFVGKEKRLSKLLKTNKKKLKEVDRPNIIVAEGKRDIPNEAFRVVRSNIDFILGKKVSGVLAFTSFNPGSGKSFIAYNLGASFALKGKKVLVIDGDLRHGSISKYVNTPRKGLSSYLSGDISDWSTLLVKAPDFDNFYVLPIGHRPPNPAELLDNGRLGQLIEDAKADFDVILIDCPPVNIVVDTQIINPCVDRTVFVVRAGLLEKKAVKDLATLIAEKKLKNITLLLNGTKTGFSSYHTYGNYQAFDKD